MRPPNPARERPWWPSIRGRSDIDLARPTRLTAAVKSLSIVAVGSLAFDSIETPAGKAEAILGGSANFFSAAASFYAPVQVVGVVGDDFPKEHLDWMAGRKIDVTGVERVKGKTFHWVG